MQLQKRRTLGISKPLCKFYRPPKLVPKFRHRSFFLQVMLHQTHKRLLMCGEITLPIILTTVSDRFPFKCWKKSCAQFALKFKCVVSVEKVLVSLLCRQVVEATSKSWQIGCRPGFGTELPSLFTMEFLAMCKQQQRPAAILFADLKGAFYHAFLEQVVVLTFLMLICELTFLAGQMRIAENIRHVRWLTLSERRVCQKPGQICYDNGSLEAGSWWKGMHNLVCTTLGQNLVTLVRRQVSICSSNSFKWFCETG